MRTWNKRDSGTDSQIVLIVHEEAPRDSASDIVHHTFASTSQDDQEKGQANLYDFEPDPSPLMDAYLSDSSIRVAIRGSDMWRPEVIAVWGVGPVRWLDAREETAVPLGIETDIETVLSTDEGEGNVSIGIRRAYVAYGDMPIQRLLMVMRTEDYKNAGTDSPIQLRIEVPGGSTTVYDIPDTPQKEQERGQANLYFVPVTSPFTWDDLDSGGSVTLRIGGSDMWLPDSFFLFGLDEASDRPRNMVPLVSEPEWLHGKMSQDPAEDDKEGFVELPLAPLPF